MVQQGKEIRQKECTIADYLYRCTSEQWNVPGKVANSPVLSYRRFTKQTNDCHQYHAVVSTMCRRQVAALNQVAAGSLSTGTLPSLVIRHEAVGQTGRNDRRVPRRLRHDGDVPRRLRHNGDVPRRLRHHGGDGARSS